MDMEINILKIDIDLANRKRYLVSFREDGVEYTSTFKFIEDVVTDDMLNKVCKEYIELVKINVIKDD